MSLQASATSRWTSVIVAPTAETVTSMAIVSDVNPVVSPSPTGSAGPNGYVYSSPGVYHSKPKVNAGAIAGGVVGSLAVLAIAVVALYWIRRRYPRRGHVETEALPAPPQYNMPPPNANALEQPAYVYKSEELGANEGLSANEGFGAKEGRKHVEAWPAGKKM